jgi:O-antigen/teichoic acid export membrane protein
MPDIKKQLIKNSASSIFQIIAAFISGLILPPFLVAKLGFETYGIWGLIVLLNQYSTLLDLGLQTGLIKLSSEYITKGDTEKVNRLFSANITVYLLVAVFISAALILFKEPIMLLFFGKSIQYKNLFDIALLYSLASLFNLITFPFSSLLKGLQRYDVSNFIDIIFTISNAIISIVFILFDFGLVGLVYGYLFSLIIKFILLIILSKKIFPEFRISKISVKIFEDLKQLFTYAPADLSVKIFSAITQTLIRFSLKNYAGIVYVGMYDIAKRLVNQVLGFSSSIFIPLLPAMSSLSAQNKRDEIAGILKKASLYINLFSLPVVFYLLFFFEPILNLWLNISDVTDITFAARILLVATLFDFFTGPITSSSLGFGIIRLQIIKLILSGLILTTLVLVFGYYFSFKGIVIAESITNLIAMIFSVIFFDKLFKYTYTSYLFKSFFNIAKVAFPTIFFFFLIWIFFIKTLPNHFIIFSIISLMLSATLIFKLLLRLNIITSSEINMVKNAFIKKRAKN